MKVGIFEDVNGKELGILAGWIGGILLIGGVLWFFTQSTRREILQEQVNRVLADAGYSQYLEAALPGAALPKKRIPLGNWYTLSDSKNRALVFSIMADGVLFPCVAVVSPSGTVDEIIPLNNYAEQTLKQIPQGIIKTYIRRIEADERGRNQEEIR